MALSQTVPIIGAPWEDVLFLLFAAIMLVSGLLVVTMRDIIRCGIAMIVSFAALGGIYVLLRAPLVGAAQVLVYIGAIAVLVLFAIMLTQSKAGPARLVFQTQAIPAAVASVVLAVLMSLAAIGTDWGELDAPAAASTNEIATTLFDAFVLPFEIVSVLLLAAVIGGVFLARRDDEGNA